MDTLRPMLIALADDSAMDRTIIARMCMRRGCTLVCFVNAKELLEDMHAFSAAGGTMSNYADAVILDCEMPGDEWKHSVQQIRIVGFVGPVALITANFTPSVAPFHENVLEKPLCQVAVDGILAHVPRSRSDDGQIPHSVSAASAHTVSQHRFLTCCGNWSSCKHSYSHCGWR
jgi:CheY-like chemotaxis protein